ncbi:hypothetical protein [Nocardia pseudobrasiliensis]|uniref:Uncharacterized protein n=1 Tax=Nocardia pseudobrasiliensis TaxID=45979 RepID=A0A370I732_9NOCA|nr:hypothetical protein [Nocardia pseudobrasiliensis]RDI66536.1 hypothetical protein DFR76_104286 [Nocardia pseudobrasiliensis]
MTDADFASFGEPNRTRPEGYRLTHPVNDSGSGPTSALTGYDTSTGRTGLGHDSGVHWTQPDTGTPWPTGAAPTVTPRAEPPTPRSESIGAAPESVSIRPDSRASVEPVRLEPQPRLESNNNNNHRVEESAHRLEPEPTRRIEPPAPTSRRAAPEPPQSRRAANRHASSPLEDAPTTVDIHLVMRLLLASHTLETVAKKAESGEASLEEFIRAAHRARTTSVELVSAWFGGAGQMRQFAEALLAATETA